MNSSLKSMKPFLIFIAGFFTFGITDLWFIYTISDKLGREKLIPMKQLALTLVTFGLYGIYWTYKIGKMLIKANDSKSINKRILCVILSACFLRCASIAVFYSELDNLNNT